MDKKEINIKYIQSKIGWAYHDIKWINKEQARIMGKKRNLLLKSINGRANYNFGATKIYTGSLSPGCMICGQGYWSCFFINRLCSANCFYCPQDRSIKKEQAPQDTSKITYNNPKAYVDALQVLNFKGTGISGGEPFLVFDRLVSYIKEIRKRMPKEFYIWLYTNGDFLTEDKLLKIKELGLNEIRFNISARSYNLKPVEMATKILDTVTVEIPLIPEEFERVKDCLPVMQNIGVKYLNVHQLFATENNYKNLIKHNYTFLHSFFPSVLESELCALKLINHALDNKIKLPINYCSSKYKTIYQAKGLRERIAPFIMNEVDKLTDLAFVRQLTIKGLPIKMNEVSKMIPEKQNKPINFVVKYYDLGLTPKEPLPGLPNEVFSRQINIGKNLKEPIFISKKQIGEYKITNREAMNIFLKMYIKNMAKNEILSDYLKYRNLKMVGLYEDLKKIIKITSKLEEVERIESGLQDLY